MQEQLISIPKLLSVLLSLAQGASTILKHAAQSKTLEVLTKGDGSLVTKADLMSQKYITTALSLRYSGVELQAEENKKEVEGVSLSTDIELQKMKDDRLTFLEEIYCKQEELVVIVDPLDGTKDFIAGALEGVTVLLGVSWKGIAAWGVVHAISDKLHSHKQVSYFGGKGLGVWKKVEGTEKFIKLQKPAALSPLEAEKVLLKIVLAETMPPLACKIVAESIAHSQAVQISGAGTRILLLMECPNNCHAILQEDDLDPEDCCAPIALATELGITVLNFELEHLKMTEGFNGQRYVAFWPWMESRIKPRLSAIKHMF